MLLRVCKSAPDMRAITMRQDELYGASLPPLLRRIGDLQTVGLFCSFLEDRFALPGDQIMAPATELIREFDVTAEDRKSKKTRKICDFMLTFV